MSTLGGQVAIVTGASRGIGSAVARRLARLGARVALLSNEEGALREVQQAIVRADGVAECYPLDIRDGSAVGRALEQIVKQFGSVDVLVNGAGVAYFGGVARCTEQEWDDTLDINLKGYFLTCKAVLPLMKRDGKGSIINMSSIWAQRGSANMVAYSASKFGIESLTQSLAEEVRPLGIKVSSIILDKVDTDFRSHMTDFVSFSAEQRALMLSAEDVADTVSFILSSPARCLPSSVTLQAFLWR
jgi:3-oxoacyl-[acyl-carrier protein] reductase